MWTSPRAPPPSSPQSCCEYLGVTLFEEVHLHSPKQPQVAHTQPEHCILLAISSNLGVRGEEGGKVSGSRRTKCVRGEG